MFSFTICISQTPRITFINEEDIMDIIPPKSLILNIGFNRIFCSASIIKQMLSLFNSLVIKKKFSIFQIVNNHNLTTN